MEKKKILKNNVLLLEFDNRGILVNKEFIDQKNFNQIKLDAEITQSLAVDGGFSKKFFSSVRKRFINKTKSLEE